MLRKRLGAGVQGGQGRTVAMEMSIKVYPEAHGKWKNTGLELKSGSNPILITINYITWNKSLYSLNNFLQLNNGECNLQILNCNR